jgi:tRNA-dihydrouridine synthase B
MDPNFYIGDVSIGGRVLNAPMTGVSDLPFRRAASKCGAAYVATEMVACELFAQGRPDIVRRAAVGDGLPLMVVQLVGREARWIAEGAAMAEAAGAHIVDLNMGCPAKEVSGKLSGAALMCDLERAKALIDAAVNATRVPVTLKMRLGWDDENRNAPELAQIAEQAGVKAITVHGRTRRQLYNGVADWRAVSEVKQATRLPIVVNGDVTDAASAREALKQSGADAIMIGRGAYGRPWIASSIDKALAGASDVQELSLSERLGIALDHFRDSLRFYGDALGLKVFRKHLGWYVLNAPMSLKEDARSAVKSRLCRLTNPHDIETGLIDLWSGSVLGRA